MPRLLRVLLIALITLLLLECVLQALALGVWWWNSPKQDADARSKAAVLCVGDSYTFGIGASTPEQSYPMQLQKRLAAAGRPDVKVVNAGWPGQTSRDVLTTLSDRIRSCSPQVVCVLVGANDRWNRPQLASIESLGATIGFQFRLRTWRLLQIALRGVGVLQDARPVTPQPPTSQMIDVARSMVSAAGVQIAKEPPDRPPDLDVAVRTQMEEGRRLLGAGDYKRSLEVAGSILAKVDCLPASRLAVESHVRMGDRASADRVVQRMRELHEKKPTIESYENLGEALNAIGSPEERIELLGRGVATFPRAINLWHQLAFAECVRDQTAAVTPLRRYLELCPTIGIDNLSEVSYLGRCIAHENPDAAAKLLSAGLLLAGDLQGLPWAAYQIICTSILKAEQLSPMFSFPGLDARGTALLRQAHEDVFGTGDKEWQRTLKAHYELIDDTIKRSGANAVYLSYPFRTVHDSALVAAVTERQATFVSMVLRFDQELKTMTRNDLFVADGHCNDAGYGIMAEEVAKVVAPLLHD